MVGIFGQKCSDAFRKVQGAVVDFTDTISTSVTLGGENFNQFFSSITTDQIIWENKFISSMIRFNKQIDERLAAAGKSTKTFWEKFLGEGSFAMNIIQRTMETQIFDLFKTGTINMKSLWSSMLDAILREIAAFIASSIVKTFLSIISGDITKGGGVFDFFKSLLGFQQGTAFVGQTGPAIVHEGERILSATQNKDLIKIVRMQSRNINALSNDIMALESNLGGPIRSEGIADAAQNKELLRILKTQSGRFDEIDTALLNFGPDITVPADRFIDIFGDFADVAGKVFGGIQQFISEIVDFRNDIIGGIVSGIGGREVVQFEAGLTPRPGAVNITVEGNIITEQGLIQTVKDGIDILNEDIFDPSKFGAFAGVNING